MKKLSKLLLKQIMVLAIQLYFLESGINLILKTLYQVANNSQVNLSQNTKIKSILLGNPKPNSRINQLKAKYANENLMSYDDMDLASMGTLGTKLTTNLKVKINLNIDPLLNGGSSILDNPDELPNFLLRGLKKLKNQ